MTVHQFPDVTVVAEAGMVSGANQKEIEAACLSFILGMRIPRVPYLVTQWRCEHPGEELPDDHVLAQPGQPTRPTAASSAAMEWLGRSLSRPT